MTAVQSESLQRLESELPLRASPWQESMHAAEFPEAGVLVALTNEPRPRVLLGRRALHLPLHPGEVAFAGGKREPGDDSPWATAIREAREEVGLTPQQIRPLGELEPLVTRTGFRVYPCVAAVPAQLTLQVDAAEFDSVLMPELYAFADRSRFRLEVMFDGERNRKVPHYRFSQDNIWGVTAAILALVVNVAYDAGLDLQRDWKEQP